ncbi:putative E3 ubiquitin-protein ligase UPL2 [Monocercomonoides exilis]|uniref:putative E3 ubiquitin-protein ligase UPL2 n=1 Tax=Monocercomonoides exilis TaxID=2049356 RepID=UPI00355A0EA4|nr:putative E3 ubiquitin-protein ligase UPL2 [Monocercomonoides exilis]|eukprot:MONOS_3001.1-p1 / transcript=MONOS_3001.1 / gene=MONOS_3001 / organism=Monocercomonoides_exilis_PA203 / gene_product=E3 ubiquitin-protein ligase UPL2 isoform 1 / transcript_product=E3 ubiquitin-protein ligase UPL2 isoform 1 / location=Mono_scaffold00066:111595-113496(-) / protein_length=633 / sequence_SO=supercontig / SO=protein_coding / is_pseudo=false
MIFLTFLSTLGNLTPKEVPIVPKCSIIFALKCLCSDSSNHRFLHFYGLDAILIDLEKDENKEVRSFASDAIKMLKNVNMQLWDHVYCAKMSGTRRFNDFPGDDLMRSATLLEKTKSSFLMDQTCSCQQISSILMTKIFNEYIYRPHITQPNKVVASSRTLELRPFSELCTLSTSILSSPKSDCPEAFKLPGCESKRLPFEESSYLAYSKKENFQKDLNKRKCEIIASVFKYQKLFSRRGFNIYLHRKSVFGDAVNTVMKMSKNDLDSKWMIVFLREYGFDNGGLFREFVTIVVSELCDVNVGIMNCITDSTTSRAGCGSLILRRREKVTLEDLTFCRFFGRIIAKAFEMSVVLPVNINELFFKQLLRSGYCSSSFASSLTPSSSSSPSAKSSHLIKEMLNDLSLISADICSSLQYVLECETPAKLAELDLHFVTTLDDEYGAREFPLVPGGKFIQVVMENREEFVALSCLAHLVWGTEQQMEAIRVGFNDVIPLKLVASAIRGEELAMIMCGDGEVNASDLRAHTEFVNGAGYKEIDWFFEIVEEMSKEEKARLMVFVTGSPRVPFGGASRLIGTIEILRCFRIYMIISRKDILPRSHTCNNQIDLPLYSSKEIMRKCLLIACFEGCVGFEMW